MDDEKEKVKEDFFFHHQQLRNANLSKSPSNPKPKPLRRGYYLDEYQNGPQESKQTEDDSVKEGGDAKQKQKQQEKNNHQRSSRTNGAVPKSQEEHQEEKNSDDLTTNNISSKNESGNSTRLKDLHQRQYENNNEKNIYNITPRFFLGGDAAERQHQQEQEEGKEEGKEEQEEEDRIRTRGQQVEGKQQEEGKQSDSYSYFSYSKEESSNPVVPTSSVPLSSKMKNDIDSLLEKHYLKRSCIPTSANTNSCVATSSNGNAPRSSAGSYFANTFTTRKTKRPPTRSPMSPLECIQQRGERGSSAGRDKRLSGAAHQEGNSNHDEQHQAERASTTTTAAPPTTTMSTRHLTRQSSKPRIIADFIPEVHFLGEIKSGYGFNNHGLSSSSLLTCKWSVDWGTTTWSLLEGSQEGQTQFSTNSYLDHHHSSSNACVVVWNHPIDLHFTTANLKGWPRIVLQVWKLDSYGTASILGYGFTYFPATPGTMQELEVKCWRPRGTLSEEISHFFLGSSIRLTQERLIVDDAWEKRQSLVTVLAGTVKIQLSCIMRYFENQRVCTSH